MISRGKNGANSPIKYLLSAGCGLPDEYSVNQHPSNLGYFSSLNFQTVRLSFIFRMLILIVCAPLIMTRSKLNSSFHIQLESFLTFFPILLVVSLEPWSRAPYFSQSDLVLGARPVCLGWTDLSYWLCWRCWRCWGLTGADWAHN